MHPLFIQDFARRSPLNMIDLMTTNIEFMDKELIDKVINTFIVSGGIHHLNHKNIDMFLSYVDISKLTDSTKISLISKCYELDKIESVSHFSLNEIPNFLKSGYLSFLSDDHINKLMSRDNVDILIDHLNDGIIDIVVKIQDHIKPYAELVPGSQNKLILLIDKLKFEEKFTNLYQYANHLPSWLDEETLCHWVNSKKEPISTFNWILDTDTPLHFKKAVFNSIKNKTNQDDIDKIKFYYFKENIYENITNEKLYTNIYMKHIKENDQFNDIEMKIFITYLFLNKQYLKKRNDIFDAAHGLFTPFIFKMLEVFNLEIEQFADNVKETNSIDQSIINLCIPSIYKTYGVLEMKPNMQDIIKLYESSVEMTDNHRLE